MHIGMLFEEGAPRMEFGPNPEYSSIFMRRSWGGKLTWDRGESALGLLSCCASRTLLRKHHSDLISTSDSDLS